jgi:hypothetical protein
MQNKAEEVHHANTTSQPEQHTNNANTKYKKPQTAPTNLCTLKPNTTTNKNLQPNSSSMQKPIGGRSVLAVFHSKTMLKNDMTLPTPKLYILFIVFKRGLQSKITPVQQPAFTISLQLILNTTAAISPLQLLGVH